MEITEKNLKIKFNYPNYSVLKKVVKKKGNLNEEDNFKVIGHYTTIYSALYTLYSNLPEEKNMQLKRDLVRFKQSTNTLQKYFDDIKLKIENIKSTIN